MSSLHWVGRYIWFSVDYSSVCIQTRLVRPQTTSSVSAKEISLLLKRGVKNPVTWAFLLANKFYFFWIFKPFCFCHWILDQHAPTHPSSDKRVCFLAFALSAPSPPSSSRRSLAGAVCACFLRRAPSLLARPARPPEVKNISRLRSAPVVALSVPMRPLGVSRSSSLLSPRERAGQSTRVFGGLSLSS